MVVDSIVQTKVERKGRQQQLLIGYLVFIVFNLFHLSLTISTAGWDEVLVEQAQEVVDDTTTPPAIVASPSLCSWTPFFDSNNITDENNCTSVLSRHMSNALIKSRERFLSRQSAWIRNKYQNSAHSVLHRRWLYIGDSTMYRMFIRLNQLLLIDSVERYTNYRLKRQCMNNHDNSNNITDFQCSYIETERCDRMENFQFPRLPATQAWNAPNFSKGEGPLAFGLLNQYCTDCHGCESHLVSCKLINGYDKIDKCNKYGNHRRDTSEGVESYIGPSYGGFLGIEFARDVELQTPQFRTTQENVISQYVARQWNKPIQLVLEFGRPNCVVNAGHHDVMVPKVTLDIFLHNIQWYLELLLEQCDYIVWLSTTAPDTNNYGQTIARTYEWNMAVLDMLHSNENELFRTNVFFLDLYNASRTYEHKDNLHMAVSWYENLALFLTNVMHNLTV